MRKFYGLVFTLGSAVDNDYWFFFKRKFYLESNIYINNIEHNIISLNIGIILFR